MVELNAQTAFLVVLSVIEIIAAIALALPLFASAIAIFFVGKPLLGHVGYRFTAALALSLWVLSVLIAAPLFSLYLPRTASTLFTIIHSKSHPYPVLPYLVAVCECTIIVIPTYMAHVYVRTSAVPGRQPLRTLLGKGRLFVSTLLVNNVLTTVVVVAAAIVCITVFVLLYASGDAAAVTALLSPTIAGCGVLAPVAVAIALVEALGLTLTFTRHRKLAGTITSHETAGRVTATARRIVASIAAVQVARLVIMTGDVLLDYIDLWVTPADDVIIGYGAMSYAVYLIVVTGAAYNVAWAVIVGPAWRCTRAAKVKTEVADIPAKAREVETADNVV